MDLFDDMIQKNVLNNINTKFFIEIGKEDYKKSKLVEEMLEDED